MVGCIDVSGRGSLTSKITACAARAARVRIQSGGSTWPVLDPNGRGQLAPSCARTWHSHGAAPRACSHEQAAAQAGIVRGEGSRAAPLLAEAGAVRVEGEGIRGTNSGSSRWSSGGSLQERLEPLAQPAGAPQAAWHSAGAAEASASAAGASSGSCDPLPLGTWPGLPSWRQCGRRQDWMWGAHGPLALAAGQANAPGGAGKEQEHSARRDDGPEASWQAAAQAMERLVEEVRAEIGQGADSMTLPAYGRLVLNTPCVNRKLAVTRLAMEAWEKGFLPVEPSESPREELLPDIPALPEKPQLVHPRSVPKPGKSSPLPLAAHLLHTLAHVELNAVHLAWDTALRFAPLHSQVGRNFFGDFLRVADDEARHFGWCQQRLHELGFAYGDMPAHNLLWVDCQKSAQLLEHRLAVIPMVQEARGLDAGPRLVQRLVGAGDNRTAGIVARICEEETAHVAVGVAWFSFVCQQLNAEPIATFKKITKELSADGVKGPFNHEARELAGLPRRWYDDTEAVTEHARPCSVDSAVPGSFSGEQQQTATPLALQDAGSCEGKPPASPLQLQERLAAMLAMEEGVLDGATPGAFRTAR